MEDLTVSQVAEIAGCHFNTVKNYEQRGVIQGMRDSNNFRRYSMGDALKLKKIINFRQRVGLPLNIDNGVGILGHDFVLGKHDLEKRKEA